MSKKLWHFAFLMFLGTHFFSQSTNTKKWRETENDSMQEALLLFDEGNYLMALPIYQKLFNQHPDEEYLKYCYGKCALSRSDQHDTAMILLSEIYEKNKKVFEIEYDLARAYHYTYRFDEALLLLDKFLSRKKLKPDQKSKAIQLKYYCINGKEFYSHPTEATVTNLGNSLNTENNEYSPVISADVKVLSYTYKGKESIGGLQNAYFQPEPKGIYYEDVFISKKGNEFWMQPHAIPLINSNQSEVVIGMSSDAQQLFIFKDSGDDHGDIYVSYLRGNTWSFPEKLKGLVNSYQWDGSCSVTADGRYLYFASDRGGGNGGKDIYRATFSEADSSWTNIVNIGDSINTAYDEDCPFIHADGTTLFYSSKGRNSMGGYDIFQAKMNLNDSTFSQISNLGIPVNTPDDDLYYVLSADSKQGFYSSGKKEGYGLRDLYTISGGFIGSKPLSMIVKGKVSEKGRPVGSKIQIETINQEPKIMYHLSSNDSSGQYLIVLQPGKQYQTSFKYNDYPVKTYTFSTVELSDFEEKEINVDFSNEIIIPVVQNKKDSLPAQTVSKVSKPEDKIVSKTELTQLESKSVKKEESKSSSIVKSKPSEPFIPNNPLQQKVMDYAVKYGDKKLDSLKFRVQIAAVKNPKNVSFPKLKNLGSIDYLLLDDGITRITVGPDFETLGEAFELNKKVVKAGQKDAFVTVLYKGKRLYLEQLDELNLFNDK